MSCGGVASRQLGFFCYVSPRIGTFGELWNYLANFKNFQISQTRIFLYFFTNRRIWQLSGLFCKFRKFANLENLNFFVFLNELAQLTTFEATLHISEICNNFLVFFSEKLFYFDFDEICAQITLQISFIRFRSFGRSQLLQTWIFWFFSTNWHIQQCLRSFFNFENFEIFLVFLLEFFFFNVKKILILNYFSMNWHIWERLRPILNIWKFFQVFVLKLFGF